MSKVLSDASKVVIYCSVLIGRQATLAFYDALMFGQVKSALGCVAMLALFHAADLISYDENAPASPAWLTVAAAMLSLFIVVPCWGQARLPRPWLKWWEKCIIWCSWTTLPMAMVLQSWFIVEIATLLQFGCARWLYVNRASHVTRAAQLLFRDRMLPQPADHLALIQGVVTRNSPLIEPLARLVAEYWTISAPNEPLDTMKDDVTFRLATQLWVKKENVASSASSGPHGISRTMTMSNISSSHKTTLEPVEVFNANGWYPRTQLGTHIPLRLGAAPNSWPRVRLPVRYLSRRQTMFAVAGRLRPCYVPDFGACSHTELARRNWADIHILMNYWLTLPFTHAAIINAVDNARRHLLPHTSDRAAAAASMGNGLPLPLVNDDTQDIIPPADFSDVPLSLLIEVRPLPWPLHGAVEFAYHGVAVERRTCCLPAHMLPSSAVANYPATIAAPSWDIDSTRRRAHS